MCQTVPIYMTVPSHIYYQISVPNAGQLHAYGMTWVINIEHPISFHVHSTYVVARSIKHIFVAKMSRW